MKTKMTNNPNHDHIRPTARLIAGAPGIADTAAVEQNLAAAIALYPEVFADLSAETAPALTAILLIACQRMISTSDDSLPWLAIRGSLLHAYLLANDGLVQEVHAPLTVVDTLRDSIERIVAGGLNGKPNDIYLDPKEGRLYSFSERRHTPISDYHGIDVHILTAREGAIPETAKRCLLGMVDSLATIVDHYQVTGSWLSDELEYLDHLYHIRWPNLTYHWNGCKRFEPKAEDFKIRWQAGQTAEEIIAEEGGNHEALCWLEGEIGWWEVEADCEGDG